jgi:hypothetical protein
MLIFLLHFNLFSIISSFPKSFFSSFGDELSFVNTLPLTYTPLNILRISCRQDAFYNFLLFFAWTQALVLARQVIYHLSHSTSPSPWSCIVFRCQFFKCLYILFTVCCTLFLSLSLCLSTCSTTELHLQPLQSLCFLVLGVKLRALSMGGRHFTTWAMSCFLSSYFPNRVSCFWPAQLVPRSSYLHFPCSWNGVGMTNPHYHTSFSLVEVWGLTNFFPELASKLDLPDLCFPDS